MFVIGADRISRFLEPVLAPDLDAFIESVDPRTMRGARHLREVAAARQAVDDAGARLRQAVGDACAAGDSWTMIGVALRTTRQQAHRKYAQHS